MHHYTVPDTLTKLTQMGDVTLFEPAGDQPLQEKKSPHPLTPSPPSRERGKMSREHFQSSGLLDCIAHVSTPQGSKPIMKAMMTTACERNCYYCPFRAGRSKTHRVSFTPDEMAGAFDILQREKRVDGLFLSSGIIKGSITTQDKILDTVEIIRRKKAYRGYIHLKIMPGIEYDQLYQAMRLADRISVNLEGPTEERLERLAPKKEFMRELLTMIQWAEQIRRDHPHEYLARTVTQFVVGAVGDTDLELLSLTEKLHRHSGLTRAYYSPFSPISQTPLENVDPTPTIREHRLYQSSFLLRDYGWNVEELSFLVDGNLRMDIDPKRAWAEENLRQAPIELNTASREELMRVPGIGPKTVDVLLRERQNSTLTQIHELRKLGMRAPENAAPFILLNGRRPSEQMSLF